MGAKFGDHVEFYKGIRKKHLKNILLIAVNSFVAVLFIKYLKLYESFSDKLNICVL